MNETKWTIDGEYIVGPDNSPRFRVMGTAPYNQAWLGLASKAPEMAEALKSLCIELHGSTRQGQTIHDYLCDAEELLNSIQNGGGTSLNPERGGTSENENAGMDNQTRSDWT